MSTERLTEPEILALLTREFPPDKGYPWRRFSNDGYCGSVRGYEIVCYKGAEQESVWYVERNDIQGEGNTVTAAIADFRANVASEAVAVGAVYLSGSMPVQTDEPCDEFNGQPCVCYVREKCCPHTERRRKNRAVEVTLPKVPPSNEYNNMETAIYATAFAIQMDDARKKVTAPLSDGRADAYWLNAAKWAAAVAKDTVNNYRATIK